MDQPPPLPDIDKLWNFADPAASEAVFRELLPVADASGDVNYHASLLTQIARTHSLRGAFDHAHTLLDSAELLMAASPAADCRLARVRCLLERGRCHNSAGNPSGSVPLLLAAYEQARDAGLDYYAVDAAHMLGIAEEPGQQLEWNLSALEAALASQDERTRRWQGALRNNIGWTYHDAGDYGAALEHFRAGWDFRREHTMDVESTLIAQWTVARCLRSLGRFDEALLQQQDVLTAREAAGLPTGFACEEIGENLLALDRATEAAPWFARAHTQLIQIDWVAADTARVERLAQLAAG
jgi:tetratricopeptide (TPR) repeat protein